MSENERPQVGEHGIKELDEFLDGFFELGSFTAERLADGKVGFDDGIALAKELLDKDFRHTMAAAGKGIERIPKEVKDLKGAELDYLVEKFKAEWLPKALGAYTTIVEQSQKESEDTA